MKTRDFKASAKSAADYLGSKGIKVPHTQMLEALASAFGERNWSTLHAQLQALNVTVAPVAAPEPGAKARSRVLPTAAQAATPPLEEMLAALKATDTVVLCHINEDRDDWRGLAYLARDVLPVAYATFVTVAQGSFGNVQYLLSSFLSDADGAAQELDERNVSPECVVHKFSETEARDAVLASLLCTKALTLYTPSREWVVEEIVDDVRDRARKHQFSLSDWEVTLSLAEESAAQLGYDDVTPDEIFRATTLLA